MADTCNRPEVIVTSKNREQKRRNSTDSGTMLVKDTDIENYRLSLESLTTGLVRINTLLPSYDFDVCNWTEFPELLDSMFLGSLDYQRSHQLCQFACKYTSFIHEGIIPALFLRDHDRFWMAYVIKDRSSLNYQASSAVLARDPKDYYYWMSLYYINLANGLFFGREYLNVSEYSEDVPRLLFNAALSCLHKAGFLLTPDIRAIQVYCCISICSRAFGFLAIEQNLHSIMVHVAQLLRIDKLKDRRPIDKVDLRCEMGKRLWYTLCIIDWFNGCRSDSCDISQCEFASPMIISMDQLLGQAPLDPSQQANDPDIMNFVPDPDIICGGIYQRFIYEIARIKKQSYDGTQTSRKLRHAISSMENVQAKFLSVYDSWKGIDIEQTLSDGDISLDNLEKCNFVHSKYLLLSTFAEEITDIRRRILPIVGREEWESKFREKCITSSLGQLEMDATEVVPSYFKTHWVVIQHMIYAAMFLLIDMLAFTDTPQGTKKVVKYLDTTYKLDTVEQALPTISQLAKTHFTAKVGLGVIQKMLLLVRSVTQPSSEGLVGQMSLHTFLEELKVGDPNRSGSGGISSIPVGGSPYLRLDDRSDEALPINPLSTNGEIQAPFLHPQYNDILADTGWLEFLDFFYGNL